MFILIYCCFYQFRRITYRMSADDFQVQNIHRYTRRTFKKNRRDDTDSYCCHEFQDVDDPVDMSPVAGPQVPGCSCATHPDTEMASILHKKCAVIDLAQQQMQRLLNGTDVLICDNSTRSIYDFLCKFKEIIVEHDGLLIRLFLTLIVGFFVGIILGGASCGTYLGRFESPILACIDNMFISSNTFSKVEDTYRCIA